MSSTIRTAPRGGAETVHQSVEAVLDALEHGTLSPDDLAYDTQRGKWVPVRDHFAVLDAWHERQAFKPLDDRTPLDRLPAATRLTFPALSEDGVTPARGIASGADELAERREALRRIRASGAAAVAAPAPPRDRYASAERSLVWLAVGGALLLLAGLGWAVVAGARSLTAFGS